MRRLLTVLIVLLFLPLAMCLEPTEVQVTVRTDICADLDVEIFVGGGTVAQKRYPAPAPCTSEMRRLGDIVFVPSQAPERRFGFRVHGTPVGKTCPSPDCVVATRNVGYLPHASLKLTVDLGKECVGVTCPNGKTCDRGECVDDVVDCKEKSCDAGVTDAGGRDVTFDVVKDVIAIDDGPAVLCLQPPLTLLKTQMATSYWTFTVVNNELIEQLKMIKAALVNGNKVGSQMQAFGCGDAITPYVAQSLNVTSLTKGVGMSAYVWIPSNAPINVLLKKSPANAQGVIISVDSLQKLQVQTCDNMGLCSFRTFPIVPVNKWFVLEVKVQSAGIIEVAYDGVAQTGTGSITGGGFIGGTLSMGPGQGALVDELRVYDVP